MLVHILRRFGRGVRDARHIPCDKTDKLRFGEVGVHGETGICRLLGIERGEILPRIRLDRLAERRGVVRRKVAPIDRFIGIVGIGIVSGELRFLVVEIHKLAVQSADLLGLLVEA